jgi:hypothetical protein
MGGIGVSSLSVRSDPQTGLEISLRSAQHQLADAAVRRSVAFGRQLRWESSPRHDQLFYARHRFRGTGDTD